MILHSHDTATSFHKIYKRIVSLVPSQTELLYDLGLNTEVVGITKFCIHPTQWYKTKPGIGGTKNVKILMIKTLNPDLVIANKEENVTEEVEALAKDFDVLVTDINNLTDAINMINDVGALTGKADEAALISKTIENKFQRLQQKAFLNKKIKAAYLIWQNPYMTVGRDTFINSMMGYCGLENVFSSQERYPEITLGDLKNNCELILLSSEPYPFKEKHLKEIESKIGTAKIILVDGEMFSWYGSRLLKAADYFFELRRRIFKFMV
jgi:ABC-type Fe3+-hydroxamate transport system substrate-binding protein